MQQTVIESFDELEYGDRIVYTGPGDLPAPYSAPLDRHQPYVFNHVSVYGTLSCSTRHGSPKYLSRSHPANDPQNWRRATPEEVDD